MLYLSSENNAVLSHGISRIPIYEGGGIQFKSVNAISMVPGPQSADVFIADIH